jgi:uncharacterized protein YfaS (alpha-2-macroglobulin family)
MKKIQSILFVLAAMLFFGAGLFGEVKILSTTPSGRTDGTDAAALVAVTFNQPMVALQQLPEGDGTGPLIISPEVKGKFRWQGTSTISFTPSEPLKSASSYTVTVKGGFKSGVSGERLAKDFTFSFDTLRPALLYSNPYEGSSWVDIKTGMYLVFNMNMDAEKAAKYIKLYEKTPLGLKIETPADISTPLAQDFEKNRALFGYYLDQKQMQKGLAVKPAGDLKRGVEYILELQAGLPAKEGSLGFVANRDINLETYFPFKFIRSGKWDSMEPTEGLEIVFTNPVQYRDLMANMEIKPPVKFDDYYYTSTERSYGDRGLKTCRVYLNCELSPSTEYSIKIKGALKDIYDQQLGGDVNETYKTTDFAPSMRMPTGMGIIESYVDKPSHPLTVVNVPDVHLNINKLSPDDIAPYYKTPENHTSLGTAVVNRDWHLPIEKNKRVIVPIDLKEGLNDKDTGILYTRVEAPQQLIDRSSFRDVLLQVTTLGVTAKFSPDGNLIYVSRLKDAGPVKDCGVELRNEDNDVLWKGTTDSNGFAKTPGWEKLNIIPADRYTKPSLWVIARKGDDTAFTSSHAGTGIYPYDFNISYEDNPACPEYGGQIFSERGIYRPGEQVYLKGIIREKMQGRWELPRKKEFDLIVKDSRGTEVVSKPIRLSQDFGSFNFKVALPKNAVTGYYGVYLWEKGLKKDENKQRDNSGDDEDGGGYRGDRKIRFSSSFRVEEYKPANFEVTAKLDAPEYISGDKVKASVKGWYLFGAPMTDAAIDYTARLSMSYFEPQGHPGYIYGRSYWYDEGEYRNQGGIVYSGKGALDKEGDISFDFGLDQKYASNCYDLVVEGIVTSPDRQRLSGRKSAKVHGAEYYIGIKPDSTFIEKGREFSADLITVKPDGSPIAKRDVSCRLIKREWNSVRESVNGRLQWRTERKDTDVVKFDIKSDTGPYTWKYKPEVSGLYLFEAVSKDDRGNQAMSTIDFYVTGSDYVAWERSDDDKIDLVCDKTKYKPGDTAKIMVKSPYEKADAVVTIEREGIIKQWRTRVVGSADTISVPIDQSFLPNAYVCVMLYQGRIEAKPGVNNDDDIGRPSFKIGYVNLPVDPGGKSLKVDVSTDKPDYKPGEKVRIKLKVSDEKGKGVRSEIVVAVVDYGILSLIDYTTPDPFPVFYGSRPLSVDTSETRVYIIGQRSFGEKGKNRGGGGGMSTAGIELRTNFIPTAFYEPSVVTNNDGSAELTFKLPDSLTTFKVMATAQTDTSMFGAGDSRLTVSKPVMLKPSMPRFAILNDKFSGGVLCYNNTGKDAEVSVKASAANIRLEGADTKQVLIGKNSAKEIRFDFTADRLGNAGFEFYARMGNENDGFKWSIPVKIPRPSEAVATYSSTTGGAKEGIVVPSGIFDGASSIDISLASTALIGLKGGLEYLFAYPYECLEQRTSKILPLALAGDLPDIFNLAPMNKEETRKLINDYLEILPKFQHPSGGFTFWPGDIYPSPYLTAYVLWCLGELRPQGYAINEDVTLKAVNYLKAYLRGDKTGWDWPYNVNEELCAKAFAVYALSVSNSGDEGYTQKLYENLAQMPVFAKIYLLKALNRQKMGRDMIDEVEKDIFNRIKLEPTMAHFEESDNMGMDWIWDSNVRTTAAALQAILEVEGGFANAEKVTRWLASGRKSGRWRSTQENMYVFYAFNEYVKHYEKENPDFTAEVLLDNKKVLGENFTGRQLSPEGTSLTVAGLKRDVMLPVDISKKGAGRLYYELRMIYAPDKQMPAAAEGISIEKSVERLKDKSTATAEFIAGEKYIVKLKVKTDQDRQFVVLDDPLPAGFEVVNLNFAVESGEDTRQFNTQPREGDIYRWWGGFDHSEKYDDRVLAFASYLTRGEHVYSYMVQATTPGQFLMPAAKISEMYTPEVFGRTDQKMIGVRLDETK